MSSKIPSDEILPSRPPRSGEVGRIVALSGGIGSGKSYVCRLIHEAGFPVFYCDDEAKRIIRTSPEVRRQLQALVGEEVYDGSVLSKAVLAAYICQGKDYAAKVDAIVHPAVAAAFREWAASQASPRVFMECALLFESGFDRLADTTVLVHAPLEERVKRVMARDGVSRAKVLDWIALQMPESEKAARADAVILNDGRAELAPQIAPFVNL